MSAPRPSSVISAPFIAAASWTVRVAMIVLVMVGTGEGDADGDGSAAGGGVVADFRNGCRSYQAPNPSTAAATAARGAFQPSLDAARAGPPPGIRAVTLVCR